jgi:hypothetical protein
VVADDESLSSVQAMEDGADVLGVGAVGEIAEVPDLVFGCTTAFQLATMASSISCTEPKGRAQ